MNEAEKTERREKADAFLNEYYEDYGLEFCVEGTSLGPDFLRWRVQRLNLRMTPKGLQYVRQQSGAKRKAGYKKEPKPKKKKPVLVGVRTEDLELSPLELLALNGKTMIKPIAEYEELIIDWAHERGIIEHSTPLSQMLKCGSEVGELVDAIVKDEDVIDHVGDTLVTLVLELRLALGKEYHLIDAAGAYEEDSLISVEHFESAITSKFITGDITTQAHIGLGAQMLFRLGNLTEAVGRHYDEGTTTDVLVCVGKMLSVLILIAHVNGLSLARCLDHAWNEIKDRKGHMSEGGVFVKEEPAKAVVAGCEVHGALGIGLTCEYWNSTREICTLGIDHSCKHLEIEDAE